MREEREGMGLDPVPQFHLEPRDTGPRPRGTKGYGTTIPRNKGFGNHNPSWNQCIRVHNPWDPNALVPKPL